MAITSLEIGVKRYRHRGLFNYYALYISVTPHGNYQASDYDLNSATE